LVQGGDEGWNIRAAAGLAGMVEVAAVQGRTNANLAAGYGFTGILVAFLARQNPLAVIPVAILLGGISASGGLLQRRLGLPDASVLVLQGFAFVLILAAEALRGRLFDLLWPRALLQVRAPAAIGAAS
jgi:simple sugar transport system permease protein